MDTREKIISLAQLSGTDWLAVTGRFDPLTLAQAERIAAMAARAPHRKLLAVVEPGRDTLLSAEARAALIAGLREVTAVVIASADEIRARGIEIESDPHGEERRSVEFIEFVLERQRSK